MEKYRKIYHAVEKIGGDYYYLCNRAVGRLDKGRLKHKTAHRRWFRKVTCKNCLKIRSKDGKNK